MIGLAWKAQPIIFTILILLQVIQGLTPIATAWITKEIFDLLVKVSHSEFTVKFVETLFPLLVIQCLINIFNSTLGQLLTYINSEMGRQLHLTTQSIMYQRLNSFKGLAYFENSKFYDTFQMASYGIHSGPSTTLGIFTNVIRSSITLLSFIGVLLFLSPVLAIIMIIATLPQLIIQLRISRQRFGMMDMNTPKQRKAGYLGQLISSPHFAKEVRLFNLGDHFLKLFLDTTIDVQVNQRKQQIREVRWQLGLSTISNLASTIAFVIVVLQAFEGQISLGDVTLYISAFSSIQGALSLIILSFANLNENILFFTRFNELMNLPPELRSVEEPHPLFPLKKGIELKNVSFRYTEDHPWILKNVNLFFPQGKCVALVGLNGAGKTTLVKLLTRLYDPVEGQILWDGIDIREFDIEELRQYIGAIFQDFNRYDLTVQDNIGLGNLDKINDLAFIRRTSEKAQINDFIENLHDGYQTILSRWLVEEGQGTDLSGGQWQKIATARMFMRNADFLILDEPTAALDPESEYQIYQHFASLVKDQTSLLISHRFSTVRIADLIAVLENGVITEHGTHEDLILKGGRYSELYQMQSSYYN